MTTQVQKLERQLTEVGRGIAEMAVQANEQSLEIERLRKMEAGYNIILLNATNENLTDAEFREFVKRSFTEKQS